MKKNFLKKRLTLLFAFVMLASCLTLTGCDSKEENGSLTMYVGLGNTNAGYYEKIRDAVLEKTGVEVTLVFNNTNDTSNAMLSRIENYDLPADIMITAARIPDEAQKTSFLDLAAYTNIPEFFNSTKMSSISIDGSIYQIPYTTRLIGIEYNKTLMKEMGWELPENFEDMVALKEKSEKAGYKFAVSGGAATGHGFNYLMHLSGAQFISSPDGEKWLSDFLSGNTDVSKFAAQTSYFEKYVAAGLFGSFHDADWNASTEFSRERALFYYNILNDVSSYDGFRYNSDGTLYGATYDSNGEVKAEEREDGEAVFYNNQYVLFDENNEAHKGLRRYHIEGAVILHDEYGSMPWLSEDGGNNCFTFYDNMYISLDKKLKEAGQEKKLEKAIKVLEYMATEEAASIFTSMYKDGFVAIKGFDIDETRIYYEYRESIEKGYLMSWYYNYFDSGTVVNVGQEINDYIKGGKGVTIKTITGDLEKNNSAFISGSMENKTKIEEDFSLEDCARLQAVMAASSLQKSLEKKGINEEVQVSLIPYATDIKHLPVGTRIAIVQEKLYEGFFDHSRYRSIFSGGTTSPVGIYMTGEKIKNLVSQGFNIRENYELYGKYPYMCVVKEGLELKDGETYLVAVSRKCLSKSVFEDLDRRGNVIKAGNDLICGDSEREFLSYLKTRESIGPEDFNFLK